MKRFLPASIFLALALAACALVNCATVNPSADTLVVRVEQTQTSAGATFDFVLHEDNANRSFWRTNAPLFHSFCEWLRTPQPYRGTNVARCVAIQFNVDDLKVSYQKSKSSLTSNDLYAAWAVLSTAVGQAASWQNIITNPVHP